VEFWLISRASPVDEGDAHMNSTDHHSKSAGHGTHVPIGGSVYDTSGRIREGPAPENMAVSVFSFISDTKTRIG
jgi:ubiquinol-cytochrome c reductase iron-sulfur subunit